MAGAEAVRSVLSSSSSVSLPHLVVVFQVFVLLVACSASPGAGSETPAGAQGGSGGDGERDLVVGLPGQPAVAFRHYAGYVPLGSSPGKALFYWFFEADVASGGESEVDRRPLLLWLNGGPGCSSVAYGAAQELGPFLVRRPAGVPLTRNPYAWNKAANLLFVESPVGVGFSYTNRSSDLRGLGDAVTAKDARDFLLGWFRKFPRFKTNEFYIAGESYAGHYVPQLAELIYQGNKNKDGFINLKGVMIGNAVLNEGTDQVGMVEYAWSHAIISDTLYHSLKADCGDFTMLSDDHNTNSNTTSRTDKNKAKAKRELCISSLRKFTRAYQDIDIYSIYTPVCLDDDDTTANAATDADAYPTTTASTSHIRSSFRHPSVASPLFIFSHPELWDDKRSGSGARTLLSRMGMARGGGGAPGYDPCAETYVTNYFNRPDVQRALHANTTKLNYAYSTCSDVIEGWNDSAETVLPILRKLASVGIRVWVYSGDTDGRVPVTSTRYSLARLGLKEVDEWRAWYHRRQVAGWAVQYQGGIVFATVRGAGHQVPAFKPDQSLSLVSHFLAGASLPRRSK